MRGTVVEVNLRNGFVAVDTGNGISVLELIGGYEIEVGDVITGDLESLGGETVRNRTQNEDMDVFIQEVDCTLTHAKSLMS